VSFAVESKVPRQFLCLPLIVTVDHVPVLKGLWQRVRVIFPLIVLNGRVIGLQNKPQAVLELRD
jgi:hypothetical protein